VAVGAGAAAAVLTLLRNLMPRMPAVLMVGAEPPVRSCCASSARAERGVGSGAGQRGGDHLVRRDEPLLAVGGRGKVAQLLGLIQLVSEKV
jgi:hypothetical protein